MKKIIFIVLGLFFLTGCGGVDKDKLINNFVDTVEGSKSYYCSAYKDGCNLESGKIFLERKA